jgi:hypothetical protein
LLTRESASTVWTTVDRGDVAGPLHGALVGPMSRCVARLDSALILPWGSDEHPIHLPDSEYLDRKGSMP